MTSQMARALLVRYLKNPNLIKHSLAVGACMEGLASSLKGDPERWLLAGLLHDIDYDCLGEDLTRHGLESARILSENGVEDQGILQAVERHAGREENRPQTEMDWALFSCDPVTGLIMASALMHPSRSLQGIDLPFLMKRFKEKRFAAGANRESIKECCHLNMRVEEFIALCLESMRRISDELGL